MKKVPQRSSHSDKIDNHRFPICSPEPNHLQIRSGNNPSTHIHLPESPLPIIFVPDIPIQILQYHPYIPGHATPFVVQPTYLTGLHP